MSTRTSYEPGTPCWVDLMAPDIDAAADFYTALFGWEAVPRHDDDGNRVYTNFMRDGQLAAGMAQQGEQMAGMPPIWWTYVATDDIDATVGRATAAGGQAMVEPMDVLTQGRMALLADPTGAMFSVWQAGDHFGSEVVNEPNAWSWNELLTRDLDSAVPFYKAVFGWETDAMPMPFGDYHVIRGGDEGGLGGLMPMPDGLPVEVPNHWAVYFLVEDAQATVDRAVELGGMVGSPPDNAPGVGVIAIVHDPQGGTFSVLQPESSD